MHTKKQNGRSTGRKKPRITIRPYRKTDEAAVVRLWQDAFSYMPPWNHPETDIHRKLSVQRKLFLVAVLGTKIAGTAMAGYDGHRGWVYYVAVSPEYRRQGIGAALMRYVEKQLARLGCPKLNLQVRSFNRDVVAFYEAIGYAVEDHISMGKLLAKEADND
jgi:ribosomal protein S18 acetylase RimI-like enzyme